MFDWIVKFLLSVVLNIVLLNIVLLNIIFDLGARALFSV